MLQARSANTPTVSYVTPRSSVPGTRVTVHGTLHTSLFGTNDEDSTNGETARFTRVWTTSGSCSLVDELGDM